jgi:hypothetical protein
VKGFESVAAKTANESLVATRLDRRTAEATGREAEPASTSKTLGNSSLAAGKGGLGKESLS